MIYLDHNASTPAEPAVLDCIAQIMAECGNASSGHGWGRRRRAVIEKARADIVAAVGGDDNIGVVFCGGATAANNLILRSFDNCFIGGGEHASLASVPHVVTLPLKNDGRIDEERLQEILSSAEPPFLVSVQGANSETGILQDIEKLAATVTAHGGIFHSDMVQWLGKLPFAFSDHISAISLSGHKFGTPSGVGALVYRKDVPLRPLIYGGGQEQGLLSGTENVSMIAGLGLACTLWGERIKKMQAVKKMRDDLEAQLQAACDTIYIVGKEVARLPNTCNVILPGMSADALVMAMDLAGFAVSAGSACSFGRVQKDSVLAAMGVSTADAEAALRVSLGVENTEAEVQAFATAYIDFVNKSRHAA